MSSGSSTALLTDPNSFGLSCLLHQASPVTQTVKNLPAMQHTWVQPLSWVRNLLEKEMAAHSNTLAWRIPRTETVYSPRGRKESGTAEHTGSLHITCSLPGRTYPPASHFTILPASQTSSKFRASLLPANHPPLSRLHTFLCNRYNP